ncbi:unnamed protein product [Auanema sp. JU1783]|nr:unnamed protein product [Auanema sp. JU1783]
MACPAPLIPRVGIIQTQLEEFLRRSAHIPAVLAELAQSTASLPTARASAFSRVAPTFTTGCLSTVLQPGLAAMPALLNRLNGETILQTALTTPLKPIPNNDRVDMVGFRVKDPYEWRVEDIASFLLDIAKRYSIPFEEMNMHRVMASLTGPQLLYMTENDFIERDPTFGSLIYKELQKMISEDTLIDSIMRKYNTEEEELARAARTIQFNTMANIQNIQQCQSPFNQQAAKVQEIVQRSSSIIDALPCSSADTTFSIFPTETTNLSNASSVSCIPSTSLSDHSIAENNTSYVNTVRIPTPSVSDVINQSLEAVQSLSQTSLTTQQSQQLLQRLPEQVEITFSKAACAATTVSIPRNTPISSEATAQLRNHLQSRMNQLTKPKPSSVEPAVVVPQQTQKRPKKDINGVRINKDGRPRKRSQHTKGNKLWEFIKDALTDPETCPSVVRWEDPVQGVFRIVESEKLARLWGERKKNSKMTYEKLSRAMRTYYEKQILVPVPKTGIYPKKLVYKFGPGAYKNEIVSMCR